VQRWKNSGFIHPDYYPTILEAAVTEKVQLDVRDFNPVDVNHPAFNASSTPSDDSTAPRAGAASPDPIPETSGLPAIAPAHAGAHKQGAEVEQ
jgi:hypothetical protein